MNARVLIVDDGTSAARALSALCIAEMTETIQANQPEDTGLGFMEYFDWLAGTSNLELHALASGIENDEERAAALGAMLCNNREAAGQVVWRNL